MKGIWRGESNPLKLIYGKIYEIVGDDCDGLMYGVINEVGGPYLYPAEDFEIIEEDQILNTERDDTKW